MANWNLFRLRVCRTSSIRAFLLSTLVLTFALPTNPALAQNQTEAKAVRNGAAVPGQEILILRHQKLKKGSHDDFYDLSKTGVWPWFEKIGTRVVGQWMVTHPDGSAGSNEYDEGWRLARYASYEHWEATRNDSLGGNGPDYLKNREALRTRRELMLGTDGPYFLQGGMAPGGPYYLPALNEKYETTAAASDQASINLNPGPEGNVTDPPSSTPIPVRNDVAQPGREIVTMRYWKIHKGKFDAFYKASVDGVWPYFEKIGARVIGQWRVVHPPADTRENSPDYDEVILLTRYASYAHWEATRTPVQLGGNGPDYDALREALALRRSFTLETTLTFMEGYMYHSPPVFLPGLNENYRRVE